MNGSRAGAKGSYLLVVDIPTMTTLAVGELGEHSFAPGRYIYVGSAMGGLNARLRRHLSKNKISHWHIDYLTNKGSVRAVVVFESSRRIECPIAVALARQFTPVPGFGCSDCACVSHLFFAPREHEIKAGLSAALAPINADPVWLERKDIRAHLGLT